MTEIIKAIEKLARERGVRIETSSPVEAIITESGSRAACASPTVE